MPHGGWLDTSSAAALALAAGLPVVETAVVAGLDEAVAVAKRLGFPVALKGAGASIVHKTDLGAVKLSLGDERAVIEAGSAMRDALGDRLEGYVVQSMAPSGIELLAGVTTDAAFGPLVIFGAGGTAAELLKDRIVRPAPLTAIDAAQMARGLRISPLLDGYRGMPVVDHAPLEALLVRLGQLAHAVPEVFEIDLNPIIATPDGLHVVDLRVRPPCRTSPTPSCPSGGCDECCVQVERPRFAHRHDRRGRRHVSQSLWRCTGQPTWRPAPGACHCLLSTPKGCSKKVRMCLTSTSPT